MKFFIESEHKMFLAQYRAFFDAMQNLGVYFFKIELIIENFNRDSVVNFVVSFHVIELAQFVIIFSFDNKYVVLLGIKTAFVKSHIPAYLAVKGNLNKWFAYIKHYTLVHISSNGELFTCFKDLVSSDFNKCGVIFFNTYLTDLYKVVFEESLKVSKFVAKKFLISSQIWELNDFNPMFFSNEDSYNEFTIIRIWALFCKVYKLSIKGDVVLDENNKVLGKCPQYLVDEFYDICRFLMVEFLMFNFYNLDPVYLSVNYMDKAEKLITENPRLLNLDNKGV